MIHRQMPRRTPTNLQSGCCMPSFDYSEIAATALELIAEFGASTTLTAVTPGTYNPANGAVTPTTSTQTVSCVVFPYGDKMVDGTLIKAADRQAFIAADGLVAPSAGDTIAWESATWQIVRVKTIAPAGSVVVVELQIRR